MSQHEHTAEEFHNVNYREVKPGVGHTDYQDSSGNKFTSITCDTRQNPRACEQAQSEFLELVNRWKLGAMCEGGEPRTFTFDNVTPDADGFCPQETVAVCKSNAPGYDKEGKRLGSSSERF